MAYDEGLAERIRDMLDGEPGVTEQKMFGGVAFLLGGNMFVGVVKADLMVRVGPSGHEAALRDPFARPMDFTGKAMTGYVFVAPRGTSEDPDLARWVRLGRSFAAMLPEKDGGAKSGVLPRRRATPRRGG